MTMITFNKWRHSFYREQKTLVGDGGDKLRIEKLLSLRRRVNFFYSCLFHDVEEKAFKGTLIQIWKSCNIFVFVDKIVWHELRMMKPFIFGDMHTLDMQKICLQTHSSKRMLKKLA